MDYSYIPQLYQQGVQHGLDRQMQAAMSVQPVSEFLAALRQGKQDQLQQQNMERQMQLAEIQQQRADDLAQHQRSMDLFSAAGHISRELSPDNVDAYRAATQGTSMAKLIPPDKVMPAAEVPAVGDPNAPKGQVELGGEIVELSPEPTPKMSWGEIVKKPSGSQWQAKQDELSAKNMRAEEGRRTKEAIAANLLEYKRDRLEADLDPTNPKNLPKIAAAEKFRKQTEMLSQLLEAGEPAAKVEKMRAEASAAYARAKNSIANAEYTAAKPNPGKVTARDVFKAATRANELDAGALNRFEIRPFKNKKDKPPVPVQRVKINTGKGAATVEDLDAEDDGETPAPSPSPGATSFDDIKPNAAGPSYYGGVTRVQHPKAKRAWNWNPAIKDWVRE